MNKLVTFAALLSLVSVISDTFATERVFASQEQRTTVIELYTSEGCSSCPPADHWLSRLKSDPRLWNQIVPVAFHVDYWNYLGWRDRFSNRRFSLRQSDYEDRGYLRTVYTPGVMKNGREWWGWRYTRIPTPASGDKAGMLKANIVDENISVDFRPFRHFQSPLKLNVAFLGFDLSTHIDAGENSGKVLKHDFTVLDFHEFQQAPDQNRYRWNLDKFLTIAPPEAAGLALWVTEGDDPTPIQATGGWLK